MQVIVGLGNPGREYEKTRHNAGFMVVDRLAKSLGASWKTMKKLHAEVAQSGQVTLVKPDTFMNDSGLAVRSVLEYFHFGAKLGENQPELWIAHDDLDLELGRFKVQLGTGPKVHNGLSSIYQHLHTEQFWHVRIGIDTRGGDRSVDSKSYVLMPFNPEEQQRFDQIIDQVRAELIHRVQ